MNDPTHLFYEIGDEHEYFNDDGEYQQSRSNQICLQRSNRHPQNEQIEAHQIVTSPRVVAEHSN